MLLGCRVVRGPDWKWNEQDGGEGCVGTIVDLQSFADGRPLPTKTVLVCWDTGKIADYRAGLDDSYDLRVFDSASAGVIFTIFTCNGCMQSNIAGVRWHCAECHDYDLCNTCYMNGVHDINHSFIRFHISNDRTNGTEVGKRSAATQIQSKGLFLGASVKRGKDWNSNHNLGGSNAGKVVGLTAWQDTPRSAVLVKWTNTIEISHRVGYGGTVELQTVNTANGPRYYRDHLPIVSVANLTILGSSGGEGLKRGDKVTIHLDEDTLKTMAEGHGGWVQGMEKAIGQVGKVAQIDADGDIHVNYGLLKWVFHPEALYKVADLRPGDKVRIVSSKVIVMELQGGHGGWNNAMEEDLGKEGKVVDVDGDGDATVTVGSNRWVFNAASLILESKEEDRSPPGQKRVSTNPLEELLNTLHGGLMMRSALVEGLTTEQLVLACTLGDLEKVREITGKDKTKINQKSVNNKTALHVGCHQGNAEIVSFLLENGADKTIRDEEGYTALHHAAYGDKTGICVVLLLNVNTDVNSTDLDRTKVTPLHLAVQQGNDAAVCALTQSRHCNVNLQDVVGDTPLHEAILRDQTNNITEIFRINNLDPSICNQSGFNVLQLACLKNNQHAAKLLIDKFPGLIDIPKEDGFTCLHIAAVNNHTEIAKMLMLSGHCSIDLQNNDGRTALSLAVSRSFKVMIELLIEHGVKVDAEDNDGDTPLHVAVMKHMISFVGIDLKELLGTNDTPENSGKNVDSAIALFLVLHGADVNYSNHQGKTPLDLCIDKGLAALLKSYSENPPRTRNALPASGILPASMPPQRAPLPRATVGTSSSGTSMPPTPVLKVSPPMRETKEVPNPIVSYSSPPSAPPGSDVPMALSNPTLPEPTSTKVAQISTNVAVKESNINPRSSEIETSSERTPSNANDSQDDAQSVKKCYELRIKELEEEKHQMELIAICQICMDRQNGIVFDPCGHKACQQCSHRITKKCHVCKTVIVRRISTF